MSRIGVLQKRLDHKRWIWMMDWCKRQGIAPAKSSSWKLAAEVWAKAHRPREHNQSQVEDMEFNH